MLVRRRRARLCAYRVIRTLIAKGYTPDIYRTSSARSWRLLCGRQARRCGAMGPQSPAAQSAQLPRPEFSGSGLLSGTRLFDKIAGAIGKRHDRRLTVRYAAIATEIGTGP